MNNKFKKIVATGLAVTSIATAGGMAVKHQHDSKKTVNNNEYTVKSGDTLYGISKRYYGSEIYFDDIADYNDIENPDKIKVGDTIKLPNSINNDTKINENPIISYTISSGDNMISICEKNYNDNSYETALRLAKYNGIEDVNKIKIGQTINIPTYEELLKINPYPYDYECDSVIKK